MPNTTQPRIAIASIVAGDNGTGHQDRTHFNPTKLQELADSIRELGLLQPVTVRALDNGGYQLVAGERRFRACKLLGWADIPANVANVSDAQYAALMLAENTGREDLDPVDEAMAYQVRIDALGWTVADCAKRAGVSEVRVQFRLKLLKLRGDLQELVRSGNLQLGYAQILADANLDTNRQMIALSRLRENSSPTPPWFRTTVAELLAQQAQGDLFDFPLMTGELPSTTTATAPVEPPTPATTKPPVSGRSLPEIVSGQIAFWQDAAAQWDALGKPFKRQECEAAAHALAALLVTA